MNKELKPCPFCGGEATLWRDVGADRQFHILCGCGGRVGWFETETEAIEAWNTRKPIDNIVEQLEELRTRTSACADPEVAAACLEFMNCEEHFVCKAIEIVKGGAE